MLTLHEEFHSEILALCAFLMAKILLLHGLFVPFADSSFVSSVILTLLLVLLACGEVAATEVFLLLLATAAVSALSL